LRLNDDGKGTTKAKNGTSTKHTLEIFSSVAQKVYISGNTWLERTYPIECRTEAQAEIKAGTRNKTVIKAGNEDSNDF